MKLTLADRKEEAGDAISFFFLPDAPLAWQAGQFLHYTLPHQNPDQRGIKRWFTIASAPHEGRVQVTTRFTADKGSTFKRALRDLPIGATIEADGPEGDFIITDPDQTYVFIAGGIGITPYRAILLDLAHRGLPIHVALLYGNRNDEFVFKSELEALAKKYPTLKIRYAVSPAKIDEFSIRNLISDLEHPIFYTSGPEPMVEAVEKMLAEMGVPDEHSKRDYFPGYLWP